MVRKEWQELWHALRVVRSGHCYTLNACRHLHACPDDLYGQLLDLDLDRRGRDRGGHHLLQGRSTR